MRRVFKFTLLATDEQVVAIPGLIRVLHLAVQNNIACIWCLIDDSKPMKRYTFITHGTGHNADDTVDTEYVGSYMLFNGSFVGHVFMRRS